MTQESMMTAAPAAPAADAMPAAAPTPAPAPPADGAPAAPAAAAPATPPAEVVQTPEQIAEAAAATAAAELKAAGAPEKYEDFKAPEGAQLDGKVMEEFSAAARELNLPQAEAQKLVDKMSPILAARQAEQMQVAREGWITATKADKEFGGDALAENLGHASRAMTQFASPELKTLLNESGLGDHPEMVRFMVKAGKALGEDKIVNGGQSNSGTRDAASVLYPTKN